MHRTIKILKESGIVESIISIDTDAYGEYYLLNGWKLHVWEHMTPRLQRYAYHVSNGSQLVIRWDNAPHHRQISTFPNHKHFKDAILESRKVTIGENLEELEKMIRGA